MAGNRLKTFVLSLLFGYLTILALGLFLLALNIKMHDFIALHVNIILIVSGALVFLFILLGKITTRNVMGRAKENLPQ